MIALVNMIKSEVRIFGNTIKEAFLHPLSNTVIDKRTGKVLTPFGSTSPPRQLAEDLAFESFREKARAAGGVISDEPLQKFAEMDLRLVRIALANRNVVELRHLLRPILSEEEIGDGDVSPD